MTKHLGASKLWDETAATELLLELVSALDSGHLDRYAARVHEAATMPERSSVLIEMLVRLCLYLATERAERMGVSRQELLPELVGSIARRYYGTEPP